MEGNPVNFQLLVRVLEKLISLELELTISFTITLLVTINGQDVQVTAEVSPHDLQLFQLMLEKLILWLEMMIYLRITKLSLGINGQIGKTFQELLQQNQ